MALSGCGRVGFAPAPATQDSDAGPACLNCGACPTDCDDADACTIDTGSGSGCNLVCSHTPVAAANGDGCCPEGANATNDTDCKPRCGNGVTEAGEECDGQGRCGVRCRIVLPSSLVHRYRFDAPGPIAFDSVGGADGTVVNTTLPGDGVLTLEGGRSDQYVELPDALISALTNATIEVWLTWGGGGELQRVFDFGMNSGGDGSNAGRGSYYFYLTPSNDIQQLMLTMNFTPAPDDYLAADYQVMAAPLASGTRYHVAVTFRDPGASSGKTLALYVNGAQRATRSIPARANGVDNRLRTLDDRNVWIGRANYDIASIQASIDEFRIYDTALSGAQIASSFAAGPDP